ncbi:MAG TPA: hypothetical protein VNA22_05450 [Pyrinomonadaceae bacterium]|nr:hypothetical protein [Pyrinomonadaceae bacterium]
MAKRFLILLAMIMMMVTCSIAQDPASTAPVTTPKPPVKRRSFDQFDLSTGVGNRASPARAITEFVDQHTYDGIAEMVRYAARIESEDRSSEGMLIGQCSGLPSRKRPLLTAMFARLIAIFPG